MAVEPAAPPAQLREQLLARLEDRRSDLHARDAGREPVRGFRGLSAWFWAPAFAAAILALIFAALWRHDRDLLRENQELTEKLETNDLALHSARALIDTLTAADAQRFTLVAAGTKPQPEGKAVYSSRQRSLVLLAGNLNPLPVHQIYELWLLPASGAQPVPAGTFQPDVHGSATLVMLQLAGGVAAIGFAITI